MSKQYSKYARPFILDVRDANFVKIFFLQTLNRKLYPLNLSRGNIISNATVGIVVLLKI